MFYNRFPALATDHFFLRFFPHLAHAALREPAALFRWLILRWPFLAALDLAFPLVLLAM